MKTFRKIKYLLIFSGLVLSILTNIPVQAQSKATACCQLAACCSDIETAEDKQSCEASGNKSMAGLVCQDKKCVEPGASSEANSSGMSYSFLSPFSKETSIAINSSSVNRYIAMIFALAVGAVGLIVLLMMIIGGVQWLIANGNASRISEAKKTMADSLVGLLLVLGSYFILSIVMGDFTKFGLSMDPIKKVANFSPIGFEEFEEPGDIDGAIPNCDGGKNLSGKQAADYILKYGETLKGKVTYHLGGKSVKAGCSSDEDVCKYKPCKNKCYPGDAHPPTGTYCLDCSGYVAHVYICATGIRLPGSTKAMSTWDKFPTEKLVKMDNFGDLEPGDFFGYAPHPTKGGNTGHVMLVYSRDGNLPNKKMHVGSNSCTPNGSMTIQGINPASLRKTCDIKACFFFHLKRTGDKPEDDYKVACTAGGSSKPCGLRAVSAGKKCVYNKYENGWGMLSGGCKEQ